MQRLVVALAIALLGAPLVSLVLPEESEGARPEDSIRSPTGLIDGDSVGPLPRIDAPVSAAPAFVGPAEDSVFAEVAQLAWRYLEHQFQPATGLVNSVVEYPYATIWDIGSTLAAYYSAHELGLVDTAEFDRRMSRALRTLQAMELFGGVAFNKNYEVRRGAPAGRNDREPAEGYGSSATDLGRLLVWLRIVATAHPQHAAAAAAVVDRIDFDRLIRDGYLRGEALDSSGRRRTYQEGRLGYEQYAAAGFALWGHYADRALSMRENAEPVEVLGVPVLRDRREGAHLTSEPLFLLGIELGWWNPGWEELARQLLTAQKARYEATGQVTIATEDALPLGPHYFYYYTVHDAGEDFAIVTLTDPQPEDGPRWISAKGAVAWHALFPSPYTWQAVEAVLPAANPELGWSSGVFEKDGRPTGSENINTAAVILEAALYRRHRQALVHLAAAR